MSNGRSTPWYVLHSPEIGRTMQEFLESASTKGVLDVKVKELMMLALSCVLRCSHCTETHIQNALRAGATKEEIAETLLLAAREAAAAQLSWDHDMFVRLLSNGK